MAKALLPVLEAAASAAVGKLKHVPSASPARQPGRTTGLRGVDHLLARHADARALGCLALQPVLILVVDPHLRDRRGEQ